MAAPLDLSKPNRPIRCGVILMGGETELLDIAPIDLLTGLSKHVIRQFPEGVLPAGLSEQALDMEICWVSEKGPKVNSKITSGMSVTPTHSMADCPPLDITIIGAHNITHYVPNETELDYVRKAYDEATAFITVCGGIEVPRLAGLLKGKTVTGPRFWLDVYRKESPEANWVEKRWVRDGKLWTSGTLLNGLDLMYNFCHEHWGGSEDTLCSLLSKFCAWPNRDVDYKDVPWKF